MVPAIDFEGTDMQLVIELKQFVKNTVKIKVGIFEMPS